MEQQSEVSERARPSNQANAALYRRIRIEENRPVKNTAEIPEQGCQCRVKHAKPQTG